MITPYYERNGISLYCGDCLEIMPLLDDNSIDTILTDPPYELDFMGKHWDSSGIAFDVNVWRECLRVAKPGAFLIAFGGTRTYHRLTCAIEDAGWEIRDSITYFSDGAQQEQAFMASLSEEQLAAYLELHYPGYGMHWIYGQGFPKALDVSVALDRKQEVTRKAIGKNPNGRDTVFSYKLDGRKEPKPLGKGNITAPATPLAKKFDGYKSALKPAFEPIVVAMKPLEGTFAGNAERWGVAGLNVDECRIGYNVGETPESVNKNSGISGGIFGNGKPTRIETNGRYPANVILGISGDRYKLKDNVTEAQLEELDCWLKENM